MYSLLPNHKLGLPTARLYSTSRLLACLLLLILLPINKAAHAQANKVQITTDIAPLHSLVSMLVGTHADVHVLVDPTQSPHHFSLKPSQIRVLRQSDLTILVSDSFAPSITRYLRSLDNGKAVIYLNTLGEEHSEDPHTWLNPAIATRWLKQIAAQLISIDSTNQAHYQNASELAVSKLETLHVQLRAKLTIAQNKKLVVHHDAYQHFAEAFGIAKPVAIALSDARSPGAATLSKMRKHADSADCVFSEELHDDAIVDAVTDGLSVNRGILDPIGTRIPLGTTLYPTLLNNLVTDIVACIDQ